MFDRGRSGQVVYFGMVSAISGGPVAGIASGSISGRRAFDGGALTVCSGPIIEDGGGLYHLNCFAEDLAGNNIGLHFTASGVVPVTLNVITQQNVSGKLYPASGASVTASVTLASGTTFLASGQAVNLLSGNIVQLYSGQQTISVSGAFVTAGVVLDKSGYTADSISGTMFPASGTIRQGASGAWVDVRRIRGALSQGASGYVGIDWAEVTNQNATRALSSTTVAIVSELDSLALNQTPLILQRGQVVAATADSVTIEMGKSTSPGAMVGGTVVVSDDGGAQVRLGQPRLVVSGVALSGVAGTVVLYIDHPWDANPDTGGPDVVTVFPFGTADVRAWRGARPELLTASGLVQVATLSGQTQIASGPSVVASVSIASGSVFLASGQAVNLLSGNVVQLYSGQQTISTSGAFVTAGTVLDKSGYTAGAISGTTFLASGTVRPLSGAFVTAGTVLDKSGYTANSISGTTFLSSGQAVNLLSGNIVQLYSGQQTISASGAFVVANATVPSGTLYLAPGQSINLLSGNIVQLYSGQQTVSASGAYVVAGSVLDKSGYTAGLISGAVFPASGVIGREVLQWNFSGQANVSGQRNLMNAARKLVNRFDLETSGYLSVYAENDQTIAYLQAVEVASGADPIVSLDTQ